MTKFKLYFDKDKETKWLNEMVDKGYALKGFCAGFYSFEQCEPGEYTYQIDWTKGLFSVTDDYRSFMSEMDAEIVCLWGPWVILRKKRADGAFELYTDAQSQIEHYSKILWMFKIVSIIEIVCFFVEYICALNGGTVGYAFMCIIAVLCVVLIRATFRTKRRIQMLKREAGIMDKNAKLTKGPHPLLVSGLFLNMLGSILNNNSELTGYVRGFIIGFACVAMVIGIYFTVKNLKEADTLE